MHSASRTPEEGLGSKPLTWVSATSRSGAGRIPRRRRLVGPGASSSGVVLPRRRATAAAGGGPAPGRVGGGKGGRRGDYRHRRGNGVHVWHAECQINRICPPRG